MKNYVFVTSFLLIPIISLNNLAIAGTFIFAGETNVDIITHPAGYNGTGGEITVGVCIDSTSVNAADMVIPIQNMANTFNNLQPHSPNLFSGANNDIAFSDVDFESVALHELGHCLSLAHPNIGGSSLPSSNYTSTTNGADNVFNLDSGTDTIIGSKDDIRGDDVNLHWFNKMTNDPCSFDNTIVEQHLVEH